MDYSQHLYLYFGNTILHPSVIGNFSTLDERQFSVDVNQCINCLQNQTVVGRVWILVNSKTLQIIDSEPFRCRVFYNRTFKDSHLAFIKVIYPECTFSPVQSDADALLVTSISMPLIMSTFVPPRKLPTNSTSVSVVQVLNSPCSSGELNTPGMHAISVDL